MFGSLRRVLIEFRGVRIKDNFIPEDPIQNDVTSNGLLKTKIVSGSRSTFTLRIDL